MNAPRHDFGGRGTWSPRDRLRREAYMLQLLGIVATCLIALALLTLAGAVVAIRLGGMEAAWRFAWALVGCAGALCAVGYFQGRLHG